MKRLLFIILPLCLLVSSCRKSDSQAQEASTFYNSNVTAKVVEYERPAPLKNRQEQILRRTGYTTSYNQQSKNPNWVAWHLTKAHTYGKNQRKHEVFAEDEDIAKGRRATNMDYYNSQVRAIANTL